MKHPNPELIDRFFAAHCTHDREALRDVLAEQPRGPFPDTIS